MRCVQGWPRSQVLINLLQLITFSLRNPFNYTNRTIKNISNKEITIALGNDSYLTLTATKKEVKKEGYKYPIIAISGVIDNQTIAL